MKFRSVVAATLAALIVAGCAGSGSGARTTATSVPTVATTMAVSNTTTAASRTSRRRKASTTTPAPTTIRPTTSLARPTTTAAAPAPNPTVAATVPPTTATPSRLIDQIKDTGGATKVFTVDSPSWSSTTATFIGWEKKDGEWYERLGPWTAHVGWPGWSWTPGEANGFSPIGSFTFGVGFGVAANPGYGLGWFPVTPTDYWVEDPAAGAAYNAHRQGPVDESKAPWSHFERLIDSSDAYQYAALINFNVPVTGSGRGSGIFLHVYTGGPTAGCVSLQADELVRALRWIDGNTRIIMAPDDTIRSL